LFAASEGGSKLHCPVLEAQIFIYFTLFTLLCPFDVPIRRVFQHKAQVMPHANLAIRSASITKKWGRLLAAYTRKTWRSFCCCWVSLHKWAAKNPT
jgi:hypothetical protein